MKPDNQKKQPITFTRKVTYPDHYWSGFFIITEHMFGYNVGIETEGFNVKVTVIKGPQLNSEKSKHTK